MHFFKITALLEVPWNFGLCVSEANESNKKSFWKSQKIQNFKLLVSHEQNIFLNRVVCITNNLKCLIRACEKQ